MYVRVHVELLMVCALKKYLASKLEQYTKQIGVTHQSVTVKGYKSRWGSCSSDGRLQFNWRLMQAPRWVIDYVMVHELCHIIHPNHSREFWALVQKHCPKRDEAKRYFKQHGSMWIQFLQAKPESYYEY